jgi:hypothetical protein
MKTTIIFFMVAGLLAGCGGAAKSTKEPSGVVADTDTAAPAATPAVKTDDLQFFSKTDPAVDVKAYKTYAWVAMEGQVNDPEQRWSLPDLNIGKEIQFLVDRELRARGMTEAARNPQVLVAFAAAVDMEAQKLLKDKDNNMNVVATVPQSALFVAFVDPTSEEAVWIGAASGEMQKDATDDYMKARLNYVVTKIVDSIGR